MEVVDGEVGVIVIAPVIIEDQMTVVEYALL